MIPQNAQPQAYAWYALRSQLKREPLAAAVLHEFDGVESYCPRIRYRRKTRSGWQWITEALFPGYLFARFEMVASRRRVQSAQGVRGLVEVGGKCPKIPDALIIELQEHVADSIQPLQIEEPAVRAGEPVEITSGPFAGMLAVVKQVIPSKERVAILLDFLGRELQAELPASELVPHRTDHSVANALGHTH